MRYDIASEVGFEEMYHEHYARIYNYVFYQILSREDTEDIVSSVFMKVARNASTFDEKKASLSTWLYRIAHNTLIDYYRARKASYSLDDDDVDLLHPSIEEESEYITSSSRKLLYQELARLKRRERLIVYYKFFEECTNREIARILKMNESTVGTVLSRALGKLKNDALKDL